MRKLSLLVLLFTMLCAVPVMAQAGPTFFYVVTAVDINGFESAFSNQVTAKFTKPGIQREHGGGEVQDYSLAWVQIIAEVGEKVDWVCKGDR